MRNKNLQQWLVVVQKKFLQSAPKGRRGHAEVELQNLLDHKATRILQLQKEVIYNIRAGSVQNLILIGKWGFDGSTDPRNISKK